MYQNDPMKVLTGKVRLSYVALTAPRASKQGGEPKYSATLLIPKSDMATLADINSAIQAATQEGITKTWSGVRPALIKTPIHDGDGVRDNGEPYGEECRGHWVMTASSKQKPEVVDQTLSPILSQSDIYSGMYARVTIRFFAYVNTGKKGIGCGLGNVLKVEDGEALVGGRTDAKTDFAGMVQPSYAPGAQQFPGAFQSPAYPTYAPYPATNIDPITGLPQPY